MSIQEYSFPDETTVNNQETSYTLIDTVNNQSITSLAPGVNHQSSSNELAIGQVQVSTYKECIRIISHLTAQNEKLESEKKALALQLSTEKERFNRLRASVEPSLKIIIQQYTQNMVNRLMKQVPELTQIFQEATSEKGNVDFSIIIQKLEGILSQQKSKKEGNLNDFDDLAEWQNIVEYDIIDDYSPSPHRPPILSDDENDISSKQAIIAFDNTVTRQKTVIIPDIQKSDLELFIEQLRLLKEIYSGNPEFHVIQTEDFIIIDGEKLDKEGALSLLVKYVSSLGKGVYYGGKGAYFAMSTIIQLATFVGWGISFVISPWSTAFMITGRVTLPLLKYVVPM